MFFLSVYVSSFIVVTIIIIVIIIVPGSEVLPSSHEMGGGQLLCQ